MIVLENNVKRNVFTLLQWSIALCFIGHGFWGIWYKPGWQPFLSFFNVPVDWMQSVMFFIGLLDIMIGLMLLFHATKYLLLWATCWTLFTALLRPLTDMGVSEFFERAGNFGPPLGFLLLTGFSLSKGFNRLKYSDLDFNHIKSFLLVLKFSLFSLLLGHAGIIIFKHNVIIANNFNGIGLNYHHAFISAMFEIALALVVLFKPINSVLYFVCFYKLTTELLFPVSGSLIDVFETIERSGDYFIPLIYISLNNYLQRSNHQKIIRFNYLDFSTKFSFQKSV